MAILWSSILLLIILVVESLAFHGMSPGPGIGPFGSSSVVTLYERYLEDGASGRYLEEGTVIRRGESNVGRMFEVGEYYAWVTKTDDSVWEINTDLTEGEQGEWDSDNSEWDSTTSASPSFHRVLLYPVGTWNDDYRPTKLRATVDCSEAGIFGIIMIATRQGGYNTIISSVEDSPVESGENVIEIDDLDFSSSLDIERLNFADFTDPTATMTFSVTKIEFQETTTGGQRMLEDGSTQRKSEE